MSHLRLHRDDFESGDCPEPIPFPTMPSSSRSQDEQDDDAQDRTLRLAYAIERSLDDVQRRLDDVKNQLDDAFRIPVGGNWPPSAA